MSFTDRFIKLPIRIFNVKQKELTGKEDLEDSYIKINPLDISSYRPSYTDDDNALDHTTIETKSGDTTTICLTIDEFETAINDFMK